LSENLLLALKVPLSHSDTVIMKAMQGLFLEPVPEMEEVPLRDPRVWSFTCYLSHSLSVGMRTYGMIHGNTVSA
jgi:hypothetical protein